jgi:hypothetical protein
MVAIMSIAVLSPETYRHLQEQEWRGHQVEGILALPSENDLRTLLLKQLDDDDRFLDELDAYHDALWQTREQGKAVDDQLRSLWDLLCQRMRFYHKALERARTTARSAFRKLFLTELGERSERVADLMRSMVIDGPDLPFETPDDIYEDVWTIHVSWKAHLRAMWNLLWSALRYPNMKTTIELKTGRVLRREKEDDFDS